MSDPTPGPSSDCSLAWSLPGEAGPAQPGAPADMPADAVAPPAVGRFPEVGETLGEFRLAAELGRGAVGRVFLAAQPYLGERPVVVKLTPRKGQEHLTLARLL